jgi:uncharacterized repeat protein (TIGR01451 family)
LDTTTGDANGKLTQIDGVYSFFLKSPAQTGLYTIDVSDPQSRYTFKSAILPPQQTAKTPALGLGSEAIVTSSTAPAIGDDTTYFTDFNLTFTDWTDASTLSKGIIHNHIALDPTNYSMQLTLTKTADTSGITGTAKVGDVIGYSIEVTNAGDLPYDTVLLDDPLTSNETLQAQVGVTDDGILNPGETWTYRASYALTSADVGAGEVQNLATLTATPQAGGNATVAPLTGTDLGVPRTLESSPSGNSTFGLGQGTATVVQLSGLLEQISDDLKDVLTDDLRQTLKRQSEQFSTFGTSAARRIKDENAKSVKCGNTDVDPDQGDAEISKASAKLTYHHDAQVYDCFRDRWTIDQVDLSATRNDTLGKQVQLSFSRRWEKSEDDDKVRGHFIGGYLNHSDIASLATGYVRGTGINAGIYGAHLVNEKSVFDYYAAGAFGRHSFDLDFDRETIISATGDYTYFGLFYGAGLEGEFQKQDTKIIPKLKLMVISVRVPLRTWSRPRVRRVKRAKLPWIMFRACG